MGYDGDTSFLNQKFRQVHYEIAYIKTKIHQKRGFWIFKSHQYSIEELLQSPHHSKIYALTEKIGADAEAWYKCGQLSAEGKQFYDMEKETTEDELHKINLEIMNREPTWWEEVKGAFVRFIVMVKENMPELMRTMLERMANILFLPTSIRKILSLPFVETSQKRLR